MMDKSVFKKIVLGSAIGVILTVLISVLTFHILINSLAFLPLQVSHWLHLSKTEAVIVIGFIFSAVLGGIIGWVVGLPLALSHREAFPFIFFFVAIAIISCFALLTIEWAIVVNM